MSILIKCTRCNKPYPVTSAPYVCDCGGVFDFTHLPKYDKTSISDKTQGIWMYSAMIGFDNGVVPVSLGEGNTPLLEGRISNHSVFLKMENQNPTGSYKDRGSSVLVSFIRSRSICEAVEDSSGNAGASFAAYAARAGIHARVYVPETASGPKRAQIEAYGAEVIRVPGPRSDASKAVLADVQRGSIYASHAYMPFGLSGIATIAYETYVSLSMVPGTVIAPVGHGGLLYGIMLGFEALRDGGMIKNMPRFVGVQSRNCAPLTSAFLAGKTEPQEIKPVPSVAEGTSVAKPVRGKAILERMVKGDGQMVSAGEDEIKFAHRLLAEQGIYCEPTSALAITPLVNDKIELPGPIVSIITGSGYKVNIST